MYPYPSEQEDQDMQEWMEGKELCERCEKPITVPYEDGDQVVCLSCYTSAIDATYDRLKERE
jgi:hypothetical protein